jgi:NADPH-dependent 2,4-dienoyl-CoA reductase/sulfur reductase-like enzyme
VPSHFRSFAAAALRLISMPRELSLGFYWLLDLKRRGVPLLFGHRLSEVVGEESVRAIKVRRRGEQREIRCDAIAIGYGLQSETQLADLANVKFAFDAPRRQWLPQTDLFGRATGRKDVYLAGDGAGMLGADAAEARGRLAAHALMTDLDISHVTYRPKPDLDAVDRAEHLQLAMRAAFQLPDDFFAAVDNETLVCRCEQVLAGELRGIAGLMGARELNRAKSYSRVGMGRCQGRLCGHAAAEILADKLGVTLDSVGRMRGQPPIKPVSVVTVAERRP